LVPLVTNASLTPARPWSALVDTLLGMSRADPTTIPARMERSIERASASEDALPGSKMIATTTTPDTGGCTNEVTRPPTWTMLSTRGIDAALGATATITKADADANQRPICPTTIPPRKLAIEASIASK
jgi:hypothetical protein